MKQLKLGFVEVNKCEKCKDEVIISPHSSATGFRHGGFSCAAGRDVYFHYECYEYGVTQQAGLKA